MKVIERKRWRLLMPGGGAAHAARVTLAAGRISKLHTHDFAEIFWVERGTVRHETEDGVQTLAAGSLVGIRPERRHRLDAPPTGEGVIFNLAFPLKKLRAIEAAHPEAVGRLFGVSDRPCPVTVIPDAGRLELRAAGDALLVRSVAELELDYRLLQILHRADQHPAIPPAIPDWLARGLDRMAHPDEWAGGLARFHTACGRSPSQVARVMLSAMGLTPIAYLNRLRMTHAERQLRLTSAPIVDVAAECGFEGLAQFYRLFAATHGESPHRYRRRHQGIVR
jgi:AraC family transcriptional regulator, dual regulator of chb operon